MNTTDDIAAIRAGLIRLAEIDPTPENRQAIDGLVKSLRARVENMLPEKKGK